MKLSNHFKLEEFTHSNTAESLNIDNRPNEDVIHNLKILCTVLLEPIRNKIEMPIFISSGYRCEKLNMAVDGNDNSQHMKGQAADIICEDLSRVIQAIDNFQVSFDQCIMYDKFIHISFVSRMGNRRMFIDKRVKGWK